MESEFELNVSDSGCRRVFRIVIQLVTTRPFSTHGLDPVVRTASPAEIMTSTKPIAMQSYRTL